MRLISMNVRRWLIGIGIAIVAIIIALVIAVNLININKFRPQIQAELQQKLNRPVTLGQLHLHLLPLSISVDGLTIGQPAGFPSSPPFVNAKQVSASASLGSLLGGKPDIRNLTLTEPQVELIQNAQGVWNFSNIGAPPAPAQANAPPTNAPPAAPPLANKPSKPAAQPGTANFTLSKLKIVNGQVAVTNEKTKSPRSVYNHIDVTLTNFAPGKQFTLAADIHFPGQGKELLSFNGTGGPLATSAGQVTPLNGRLSLQEVSLAGLNSISAGAIPPNTDASMSGNAAITTENNTVRCKGNLILSNPSVKGARINYPINTQYDVAMNQSNDQISIQNGSVTIGPTVLNLAGNVNAGVTPSAMNLHLTTNNASIPDLMELANAFGGGSSNNAGIKGTISADLTATGSMNNPEVNGNITAPTLQAQEITLTNVHATCKLNNGVVQLAPVTAGIFNGQENGTITLDTKAPTPLATVNTQLTGVDVNALLSAVSSVKNTLDGSLAAQANLNFAVASSANLASTLNGTLNFNVTNGHLKNVNILGELSKVGKFLNAGSLQSGNSTTLKRMAGTFNINHGVANTNNLAAVLDEGTLSANGSLNLVNQALNMHMTAVLSSGTSKSVGGTGIGGLMNTALANNKGELVLPVLVTGTTEHPVFAPDVQAIAKMKINHLLPTTQNPGGVVGALLGGATGQKSGQNKQQQSPLNSLFNALGKKH